jgi:tRNA threonylcarbamoyladenosine biosynthesis protein TsaE
MRLAREFAGGLDRGAVVCLQGGLGAGKTHFVKGMATGFGIEASRVHSPTFSLIHEYRGEIPLYHFDCYRLESVEEALEVGMEEYFYGGGVSVIEWPERILEILPEHSIWIVIESLSKSERKIVIKYIDR